MRDRGAATAAATRRRRAFALGAPGALEAFVESAGLTAVRTLEVPTPFAYADVATAERASLAAGPTRAAINHTGLDAMRQAFTAVLAQFVQPTAPSGSTTSSGSSSPRLTSRSASGGLAVNGAS